MDNILKDKENKSAASNIQFVTYISFKEQIFF